MSELNKAVAELLGAWLITGTYYKGGHPWFSYDLWSPSTDANQSQTAVREWCGEDDKRQDLFVEHLVAITSLSGDGLLTEFYSAITATPEELCRALLAASKESQ